MGNTLLRYVACPQCGTAGDLAEDEDGCIRCDNCEFEDCPEDFEDEIGEDDTE